MKTTQRPKMYTSTGVHIYILIFQFKMLWFLFFVVQFSLLPVFFLWFSCILRSFFFIFVLVCIFCSSLTADGARLPLSTCMCWFWCGKVINELWKAEKRKAHKIKWNGTYVALILMWVNINQHFNWVSILIHQNNISLISDYWYYFQSTLITQMIQWFLAATFSNSRFI